MSIDERLEAITHSVELLAGMQIETEKRLARLTEKVDRLAEGSDDLQVSMSGLVIRTDLLVTNIATLANQSDLLTANMATLANRSDFLAASMATLADGINLVTRITIDHDDRIGGLEGNRSPH